MRLADFRRSRRLLGLCRRFVVSHDWIPAFAVRFRGDDTSWLGASRCRRASPYRRAGRYRREGRPQPFPLAFRLTHFASTAKARAPHGAANGAPWMAIDSDRVERDPIVARPLAPFVPAAPRPTLPGPREPARFVENCSASPRRCAALRAHECRRVRHLGGGTPAFGYSLPNQGSAVWTRGTAGFVQRSSWRPVSL
jgi:hypothetical protein